MEYEGGQRGSPVNHAAVLPHLNSSTVANGSAEPGRNRFKVKLVGLPGLHIHKNVVVFLDRTRALPIQIGRVAVGHLEMRPTRKDRVLLRPAAAQYEILHAVHLVKLSGVDMPIEDHDVEVFRVRRNDLVRILRLLELVPCPRGRTPGLWNEMNTFLVPFALASSSHACSLLHSELRMRGRVASHADGSR